MPLIELPQLHGIMAPTKSLVGVMVPRTLGTLELTSCHGSRDFADRDNVSSVPIFQFTFR